MTTAAAPTEVMLSVSEAARRLDARPRDVTNLFYKRQLRDDLCPIIAGRRAIPESYIELVAQALRRENKPCGYFDAAKGASRQTASSEEMDATMLRPHGTYLCFVYKTGFCTLVCKLQKFAVRIGFHFQ